MTTKNNMTTVISADEFIRMIGHREVVIHQLQSTIAELMAKIAALEKKAEAGPQETKA